MFIIKKNYLVTIKYHVTQKHRQKYLLLKERKYYYILCVYMYIHTNICIPYILCASENITIWSYLYDIQEKQKYGVSRVVGEKVRKL